MSSSSFDECHTDNPENSSHSHTQNHPKSQETTQNLRNSKSKSRSPQEDWSAGSSGGSSECGSAGTGSDPFFKDFYNRKKSRPGLGDRIFNNLGGGVFEKDNFVKDLRKQIEEERKMFFDSDPFGNFPSARGSSPAPPGHGSGTGGSGSPRMGRVSK